MVQTILKLKMKCSNVGDPSLGPPNTETVVWHRGSVVTIERGCSCAILTDESNTQCLLWELVCLLQWVSYLETDGLDTQCVTGFGSMEWPARITWDLNMDCEFGKCRRVPVWQWTHALSKLPDLFVSFSNHKMGIILLISQLLTNSSGGGKVIL